jgi:hypothetical protein
VFACTVEQLERTEEIDILLSAAGCGIMPPTCGDCPGVNGWETDVFNGNEGGNKNN